MQYTESDGEYTFTKEVEIEEGKEYQYKFRVGEGDWWLLNEDEPTGTYSLMMRVNCSTSTNVYNPLNFPYNTNLTNAATDSAGNRNNLLAVPIHEEEKVAEVEDTKDMEERSHSTAAEPAPATPIMMVDKADSEPRHGDDFGADATVGQKDEHKLRAKDAEPDYVVVR